jgi:hypothetical protein
MVITFKNVRTVYERGCLMGRPHNIILITSVFLQENLPFPRVSQLASVSLVLFLVKHLTSPSFPARRCVPTLFLASQGLIFSPWPSLTFSFRWCVTIPVRFHCLVFSWHGLRISCTPVFLKSFDREPLTVFVTCEAPLPPVRRCFTNENKLFFPHCIFI